MHSAIESPSPCILAEGAPLLRLPSRPPKYRQETFDLDYDNSTLFYDAMWVEEGRSALLHGPPFLNLGKSVAAMRVVALPSGHTCSHRTRTMDRQSECWVNTPAGTVSLEIQSALGNFSIRPSANRCSIFEDKRVLMTLSKDNKLEWICDWIRFHRDIHGANAVLFFDTGSTAYTLEELEERLASVRGMDVVRVVRWNFKYGPQSYFGKYWDSDYCQMGSMENARWRFLQKARSVLNMDIDELMLTQDKTIFEQVESAPERYCRCFGKWVIAPGGLEGQVQPFSQSGIQPRHSDFNYTLAIQSKWKFYRFVKVNRCPTKWAVVPSACPVSAQWRVHKIAGMRATPLAVEDMSYRHFREINTNWKYRRTTRDPYSPALHELDHELVKCLSRVRWDE